MAYRLYIPGQFQNPGDRQRMGAGHEAMPPWVPVVPCFWALGTLDVRTTDEMYTLLIEDKDS